LEETLGGWGRDKIMSFLSSMGDLRSVAVDNTTIEAKWE
jgi:hypothetical protein